jgi:hypothetical protein
MFYLCVVLVQLPPGEKPTRSLKLIIIIIIKLKGEPHLLARLIFNPEDGGHTFLRNVGSHTDSTAGYLRR